LLLTFAYLIEKFMVLFPNAKINLGLSVLRKRDDGFHDIESLLFPIALKDALELIVSPDGKFGFTYSGLNIPGNLENNLCVKAWKLLQADYDLPEVNIHLRKVIPMGAGLGGGSADGAFMVKLIDHVFSLGLTDKMMENYARKLGSDCAFFIQNKPALVFDKGDQLKPIELDLSGYFLVLVKPQVHISTAEAYTGIHPAVPEVSVQKAIQLPPGEWKNRLKNDFEKSVFKTHPFLLEIKETFYQSGAVYASMTGSGSAVYGLFCNEFEIKDRFDNVFYWSGWL